MALAVAESHCFWTIILTHTLPRQGFLWHGGLLRRRRGLDLLCQLIFESRLWHPTSNKIRYFTILIVNVPETGRRQNSICFIFILVKIVQVETRFLPCLLLVHRHSCFNFPEVVCSGGRLSFKNTCSRGMMRISAVVPRSCRRRSPEACWELRSETCCRFAPLRVGCDASWEPNLPSRTPNSVGYKV